MKLKKDDQWSLMEKKKNAVCTWLCSDKYSYTKWDTGDLVVCTTKLDIIHNIAY